MKLGYASVGLADYKSAVIPKFDMRCANMSINVESSPAQITRQ